MITTPLLLLLLVYLSLRVLRAFSHPSRSGKRELDGKEELLHLLLLTELLDTHQHESDSMSNPSSPNDKED
jgi:hypothetical protein